MGTHEVEGRPTPEGVRAFTNALLAELRLLERMIEDGKIESGVHRVGAEQEVFLVDRHGNPAPRAMEVLGRLEGRPFTTELALFNLEINLEPARLGEGCFRRLEEELHERLEELRATALSLGADVVLAGILPTLGKSDLSLANITPIPRYHALNETLTRMRGDAYRLRIEGADELHIEHDSVMLEACNTSFQVHLQVSAEEFAPFYNAAQVALAPVVAVAGNSPLLFGKRLWSETRIALFQQSLDTRTGALHLREFSPRVHFGTRWVEESVTEIFQEDVARFRTLITRPLSENPRETYEGGGIPRLEALGLHNSTIYRWNRPCYGPGAEKGHLRIECRALPAGPSVADELANAAFWTGLVLALAREEPDLHRRIPFDDAKANFLVAARLGLDAGLRWPGIGAIAVPELVLEHLLPLAREGLVEAGLGRAEADERLDLIRDRVRTSRTGTRWLLDSLQAMSQEGGAKADHLRALVRGSLSRQRSGDPVHRWLLASLEEAGEWDVGELRVEQQMTTSLFTVQEDESLDLAAFLMDRQQIRHVLVEDERHRLVGIVSYRSILRLLADGEWEGSPQGVPVREVMEPDPITVTPDTPTREAIETMRRHQISCLPVVADGKLVGIVSERDFLSLAYRLISTPSP